MSIQQLKWDDSFSVGSEDIDLQHHYFLNLINRIIKEVEIQSSEKYLEDLMDELSTYARFHFTSEETMMIHTAYPKYEEHKKHHRQLIGHLSLEEYNVLKAQTQEKKERIISFLIEWFLQHTQGDDKELGIYLSSRE